MNYMEEELTVVFQELPDHIGLVFSITGCGGCCDGCHSPHLQDASNGVPLTLEVFTKEVDKYADNISAVIFFGGDLFEKEIIPLLKYAKKVGLKTALYTGQESVLGGILNYLDYVKVGLYKKELGGLSSKTTNQKLFDLSTRKDITYKFWNTLGEE